MVCGKITLINSILSEFVSNLLNFLKDVSVKCSSEFHDEITQIVCIYISKWCYISKHTREQNHRHEGHGNRVGNHLVADRGLHVIQAPPYFQKIVKSWGYYSSVNFSLWRVP